MRGMILAAGRGERMRPLTQHTPKPLLQVAGHHLIEFALGNFKSAGIKEIVINVCYHAEQIKKVVGDGKRFGVEVCYSEEKERLEVGGGILQALPLLGKDPFVVMSGDIITDFPLHTLSLAPKQLAHLVMVDNPVFHSQGDFGLKNQIVDIEAQPRFTFANVGLYAPELFVNARPGHFSWKTLMWPFIQKLRVTGERYQGLWYNVGTPEELNLINERAQADLKLRPLKSETNTRSN